MASLSIVAQNGLTVQAPLDPPNQGQTPEVRPPNHQRLLPWAAAAGVALAARRIRALSADGAVAAAVVGGATVSGTGSLGASALLTFFASSTLLGRLPRARGRRQRRGNERDAVQVLANGGVAAALSLAISCRPASENHVLLTGFAGALAAATADTWATEIGSRASARPRSILTGRSVPVGASGGVSAAGLLASGAGAATIAAVMASGAGHGTAARPILAAIFFGGVCGGLADSALGASVQEVRRCEACGEETELPRHGCGLLTTVVRGIPGFDNDAVNLAATLVGAATASITARAALTPSSVAER